MKNLKRKRLGRRILSVVLSLVLVLGLIPEMPGVKLEVQAAGSEPGVTAYATKDQLMTAFTPDANGNVQNVGKLIFGKDSSGNPLPWYILGKDTGIAGDNIAVFTASAICQSHFHYMEFADTPSDSRYNTYESSKIREQLAGLSTNTDYFTESEQSLMQATPIHTSYGADIADILYLLDGRVADISGIPLYMMQNILPEVWMGSNNSIVPSWDSHLNGEFLLRTAYGQTVNDRNWVLSVNTNNKLKYTYVESCSISSLQDIRPASNINMTNVSFAAAASAPTTSDTAAGSIATGTPMSLRFDGSNMSIGKVLYNTGANCITAQKGKTNGAVTLVVQGNDGTNDWYYSKKVDGTVIVSVDDMKNALSASGITNISLADCKIWLETTTDALTYAVQAEETQTLFSVPAQVDGVYQISNALELNWLAFSVNHEFSDMNAKLTANIAMNGIDWTMMENYAGTLDGAGHTISGLNQHKGFDDHKHGFIRTLASGGVVKNLTFTEASIWNREGSNPISAVIAYTNNGTIEKCVVKNSLIQSAQTTLAVVVGENNGTIRNCASISNKVKRRHSSVHAQKASGFVWSNGTNAKIENCMVYDCEYVEASANHALTQSNTGTITRCYYYEASETLSDAVANGVIEAKTAEQFASGAVCYLLNGSTSKGDLVWGQTLGTDNYPVYKTENNTVCKASTQEIYSNHNQYGPTGFCITCGSFEKPEIVNDEYRIENVGQLLWFAEFVNSGNQSANAKLTADIDMKNISWTPICATGLYYDAYGSDDGYSGTFDGAGHVIRNLTVESSATADASVGLFGTVSGTIKNLGMEKFTLVDKGKDMRAGAIVGQLIKSGKVSNCYVKGADIQTNNRVAGGIAGCVYDGMIENCYVESSIIAGNRFGYITGDACADGNQENGTDRPGVVKNCFTDGKTITGVRKGINSVDGGAAEVTAERFKSGEVAYLLNGKVTDGTQIWYQNLSGDSADAYPVFDSTHGTVYQVKKYECPNDPEIEVLYSNKDGDINAEQHTIEACACTICGMVLHSYSNGFCTACTGYEAAQPVSSTHYAELNATHAGYYAIENAGQLYWFAEQVNSGNTAMNAVLTANILVNESIKAEDNPREWTPIGTGTYLYTGIFDGNDKTVSGLYFNDASVACVGFFGYIGEGAEIKNVGVINSTFTGNHSVGGVCGSNEGSITNSYSTGVVSGKYYVGGVCGYSEGSITNSYNTGAVSGNDDVGGVCGWNRGSITNSYNTGAVSGNGNYVGGVCGWNDGSIANSYNTGAVSGNGNYVGGVCGYSMGSITNSYYNTDVYTGKAIGSGSGTAVEGKIGAQFASGEVAYLLNGEVTDGTWSAGATDGTQGWYQNLSGDSVDTIPVLDSTHGTVYQVKKYDCPDDTEAEVVYSNKDGDINAEQHIMEDCECTICGMVQHSYSNGFCTACGGYEAALPVSSTHHAELNATHEGYYAIEKTGQLYWFAEQVNSGNDSINAVLTADILVNESIKAEDNPRVWTPIGTGTYFYTGIFDGNDKTVSGLYFNDTNAFDVGFFGCIGEGAEIKNVGVINSTFTGDNSVGGVCGTSHGSITNSYNKGAVSGNDYVGGVCGGSDGSIANSYNTGAVSGNGNYVGGVCGGIYEEGSITNSYNAGEVSGEGDSVGGVCGDIYEEGSITNSYNKGAVSGNDSVGGVCGGSDGSITNSYNIGKVSGNDSVGGVCGGSDGSIANSYNTGEVSGEGNNVGGVCGWSNGSIISSYNTSEVSGNDSVGGVCGEINTAGSIANSYNTGAVSGNDSVGGVCGYVYERGSITNCYFNSDVYTGNAIGYNESTAAAVEGKTGAQFATGEVAYLLNGEVTDGTWSEGATNGTQSWYQNLSGDSADTIPVLDSTHGTVYQISKLDCPDDKKAEVLYSNTYAENTVGKHDYENGFCTGCGGYEAALPVSSTHHAELNATHAGYYAIENAGQLYWFAEQVNGRNTAINAVLTADILVNESIKAEDNPRVWTPIGTGTYLYRGIFDGNDKTISGLYFNNTNGNEVGLFSWIGNGSVIKDVSVTESSFTGYNFVGGVCGRNNGGSITDSYYEGVVSGNCYVGGVCGYSEGSITNSHNTGKVSGSSKGESVGGVLGLNNGGSITDSYNKGEVNGNNHVGGVCGHNNNSGSITSSYNIAKVSGSSNSNCVGGVCGNNYSGSITDSYNKGEVNGNNLVGGVCGSNNFGSITNSYNEGEVNGNNLVGGVCGSSNGSITSSYNTGEVSGNGDEVGGVCGYSKGSITSSYNEGVVSGKSYVGGVCGYVEEDGSITNSYSTGAVGGSVSDIGGVCGWNNGSITNSYSTGVVSGKYYVGGVCGSSYGSITNSHNTGEVSVEGDYVGGVCGRSYGSITNSYYNTDVYAGKAMGIGSGTAVEGKTGAQFASGEVAYLLNGKVTDGTWSAGATDGTQSWYQNLSGDSADTIPVLDSTHGTVYQVKKYDCPDDEKPELLYSNTNADIRAGEHNYENGFCTGCGGYEVAQPVSSTHHAELNATHAGYYAIENAGQLYWFAEQVNSGNASMNAVLTANILVNESIKAEDNPRVWTPIGTGTYLYTGIFDGAEHTVSGLYFNDASVDYVGFFGYIGEGAEIKNVGVINSTFTGKYEVGGVCGYSEGSIINCYNTGTVSGSFDVGGVCGYSEGSITNSHNTGTVSGSFDVGGVCGYSEGSIINCYNKGEVRGESQYAGGVCGYVEGGSITNSYNTGAVSGTNSVGGVCGQVEGGSITNSYNTGVVSGKYYVGGVCGWNDGSITNSYNIGEVSGEGNNVGGVCGYVDGDGSITNSYNTGAVSGVGNNVGGVCGWNNGSITNSYYNSDVYSGKAIGSSSGTVAAVEGKTGAQFASGEVAYLLNGKVTDGTWSAGATDGTQSWYQNLSGDSADTIPVLDSTHGTVYSVFKCNGVTTVYRNVNKNDKHVDENDDGHCDICEPLFDVADIPSVTGTYGQPLSAMRLSKTSATSSNGIKGTWSITEKNATSIYPKVGGTAAYEITFTPSEAPKYKTYTTTVVPTVEKKALTISVTATGRTYEAGNKTVSIDVVLQGVKEGDKVSLKNSEKLQGTLSSDKAGTYDSVTLPVLNLTGADAGNYSLSVPKTVAVSVTIEKKAIIADKVQDAMDMISEPHAGDTLPNTVNVAGDSGYSISISWDPADDKAGYNTAYTAKAYLTATQNHTFAQGISPDGWEVVSNSGAVLVVKRTFETTRKAKIIGITLPQATTLSKPHDNVQDAISELPATVTVEVEGAKKTIAMPITWKCESYDSAFEVKNTFTWTIDEDAYATYDASMCDTFGTIVVTNAADPVEQFVGRMYEYFLNRAADEEGIRTWVTILYNREMDAATVVERITLSEEFINLNLSNEAYVRILYLAILGRDPETDGLRYWTDRLAEGKTRQEVLAGFTHSVEFDNLCDEYGITAVFSKEELVNRFVERMYTIVLNRLAEQEGLRFWANGLLDGSLTGSQMAKGFLYSEEFIGRNTSDEEYINILYRAFLGREAEEAGLNYWKDMLQKGVSRDEVLGGFIYSVEFSDICAEYGINAGTLE